MTDTIDIGASGAGDVTGLRDAITNLVDFTTAGVATVPTLADLLALPRNNAIAGMFVRVEGYHVAGDGGGGLFQWRPTSTAQSDGLAVFVPDDLRSEVKTWQQLATFLRSDRNAVDRALPDTDLIMGTVELVYSDGAGSAPAGAFVTDWELHGHRLDFALDGNGDAILHTPHIDHAAGTMLPDGVASGQGFQALMRLCEAHLTNGQDGTMTVRYRHATGPGRWQRVLGAGEAVTPAMIGCTPDDVNVNNLHRLAWLVDHVAGVRPILIDNWYYLKGTLELPDHTVLQQLKSWTQAGLKVCPETVALAIDHLSAAYDDTLPPGRLGQAIHAMVVGANAQRLTMTGVRLHGNLDNNLSFLTDPNFDTDPSGLVSQVLRESPNWCGLAVTIHSNRPLNPALRIQLVDVEIGDFGGSCLLAPQHERYFTGRNVALGCSMSGRVMYGGSGEWSELWYYGFSRTSIHRAYSATHHGHRYTWNRPDGTVPVRAWPENAIPSAILGTLVIPLNGPGAPRGGHYSGIDWDIAGSDFNIGVQLRAQGLHVDGRIVSPAIDQNYQAVRCFGDNISGPVSADVSLDVFNRGTGGVSSLVQLNGALHQGSRISVRVHEFFDEITGLPLTPSTTLPTRAPSRAPEVYCGPQATLDPQARIDRQTLELAVVSDLPVDSVIRLGGPIGFGEAPTSADVTPTTVALSGKLLNSDNKLIATDNGLGPDDNLDHLPVRVLCKGLTLRVFDPSAPFVGDAPVLDRCFALMKLQGCLTPEGWVSEQEGMVSITGADLVGGVYEVTTNLLWRPRHLIFTPMSADAGERLQYVEVVTVGSGNTENAINPKLRFYFDAQTAAGETLDFSWQAAVAPW